MEIENITNLPKPNLLPIGTIVNFIDRIDPMIRTLCTVKFIEEDDDYPNLFYYYLVANNQDLNIHQHPQFGNYFEIVAEPLALEGVFEVVSQPTIS